MFTFYCRCNVGPFETAHELKTHLRKKHELFYCDICLEHLKVSNVLNNVASKSTVIILCVCVCCSFFRSKDVHTRGNSWHIIGEKVILIIRHIVAIRCVNTVINGIWIEMNYFDIYEKNISFAIFVMQMDRIIFMRK